MNGFLYALMGAGVAGLIVAAAALILGSTEQPGDPPLPGEDIRLPEEETEEERRMRQWLLLLGYSGEKGASR